jgi:hypothetical protein
MDVTRMRRCSDIHLADGEGELEQRACLIESFQKRGRGDPAVFYKRKVRWAEGDHPLSCSFLLWDDQNTEGADDPGTVIGKLVQSKIIMLLSFMYSNQRGGIETCDIRALYAGH